MIIDPAFCGSRFSTGRLLAIEDFTFMVYHSVLECTHILMVQVWMNKRNVRRFKNSFWKKRFSLYKSAIDFATFIDITIIRFTKFVILSRCMPKNLVTEVLLILLLPTLIIGKFTWYIIYNGMSVILHNTNLMRWYTWYIIVDLVYYIVYRSVSDILHYIS